MIKRGIAALVILAVAGIAWFAFGSRSPDDDVRARIAALISARSSARFSVGRLSVSSRWSPPPRPRGTGPTALSLEAQQIAIGLQQLAESNTTATSVGGSAIALLASGELDDAVETMLDGLEQWPLAAELHTDIAAALLDRADVSSDASDAARALDHAERALRLAPSSPAALFNRALAYELLGHRVRALTAWQEYIQVDSQGEWAIEAREHAGRLEQSFAPPPPASAAALTDEEMRAAAERHTPWLARSLALDLLPAWADAPSASTAAAVVRAARALEAVDVLSPATALASAVSHSGRATAPVRACLADAIATLARWRTAYERRDRQAVVAEAERAARAVACAGESPLLAALPMARAASLNNDRARAARLAAAGADRARAAKFWSLEAEFCELLGAVAIIDTRLSDAAEARLRGLKAATAARDKAAVARFEELLGEAADEQGDRPAAWRHFRESLGTLERWSSATTRYGTLSMVTIAAANSELHAAAAAFSDDLLADAEGTERPTNRVMALLQRGRALAALGEASASRPLADAAQILASMPEGPTREAWEAEHGWITGVVQASADPQAAIRALTTAIDYFDRYGRRFRLAELLLQRGYAYRAIGNTTAAAADWTRGAAVLEDQRPAIREEQLRISRAADVWDLFGELIDLQSNDAAAALHVFERAKARELLDSMAPDREQRALGVPELQTCLPRDARALVYAVLSQKLLVWDVTSSSISLRVEKIGRRRLDRLVQTHTSDLEHDASSSAAGAALAELLFASQLHLDPASTLVVVADGPLARAPFAALPRGGRWLVQSTTPLVAPSLTAFCLGTRRGGQPVPSTALLVGAGEAHPEHRLPALPDVYGEITSISQVYGSRARVLVGPAATASAVDSQLIRHRIVHIAGHALVDERHPLRSRLFLSPHATPSVLEVQDIASKPIAPGTNVVLAACSTAAGKVFSGEGTMSLARPFLAAGALAVLGSLWDVRDADARSVVERVHRRLAAGDPLDRALAAAQRELIDSGARASRWSPYVVTGGTSMDVQNRSSR